MNHIPLRKPSAAPSATLLKFLRAQAQGRPFFTANHICHRESRDAASRPSPRGRSRLQRATPVAGRSMTSAATSLEASFFPSLNGLLPHRRRKAPATASDAGGTDTDAQSLSRYAISLAQNRSASSTPGSEEKEWRSGLQRWRRYWGSAGKKKPEGGLHPNDLPPLSGFMDHDGAGLGRTVRPANELRLRCTEFDENGNVTLVNGEFKKSELIAKYGLPPRDLRKIDSSLLPSILIRPHAILVNLLHLRVLIKHNRVLVFDAYGSTDSYTQSVFMYDLEGKLRSPESTSSHLSNPAHLPYEFRALEAVLISVTSSLEGEFEGVREPVVRVLRELEEDIDRDKLRHLLIYSKKLGTFEQKARLLRDAIDDLLEADDDLASMYLTEKAGGVEREEDDHTEVEMLLESYHKVADEIVQSSGNLVSNIRNTEEIVKAILDANRNSLMLLDLKFSIGTLGIGGGTFVAALYGMNLKNFIEETDLGFWGVSAWCSVFTVIVCMYGLRQLRKVQRVSMWGADEGDRIRGRGGWATLGAEQRVEGAMGLGRQQRLKGLKEGQMLANGYGHGHPVHGHAMHGHAEALPPAKIPEKETKKIKRG